MTTARRHLIISIACLALVLGLTACRTTPAAPGNVPAPAADQAIALSPGTYTIDVTLAGGTGRAHIESPTTLRVEEGQATAAVTWSSSNYDYIMMGEERFDRVNTEGNSVFQLPVSALDEPIAIRANTTAMSEAHLIEYTLTFHSDSLKDESGAAPAMAENPAAGPTDDEPRPADGESTDTTRSPIPAAKPLSEESGAALARLTPADSLIPTYAHYFRADNYEEGYSLITIADSEYYLLIPEGAEAPAGLGSDVTCLQAPVTNIYLAASSAMDLFRGCNALDAVTMTAFEASDWAIPEIRERVESGAIRYAGKYSTPDYETILSEGCPLAIESTMILHAPEVREQLTALGVPVLVERSSYEDHPLGRMEWIRLYGLLTGHSAEAETFFADSAARVEALQEAACEPKTVVFFYITSAGYVNVRRPGDYISEMIRLAGGEYALSALESSDISGSTMNMQMEQFFAEARNADILIYNATTEGSVDSLNELLAKSELLGAFKAVKDMNVWCTEQNMFQQTTGAADMITDIHRIISGEARRENRLTFLHRIK